MNAAVLILALFAGPASSAAPSDVVLVQADDPPPPLPGQENAPLDDPPPAPSGGASSEGSAPKASASAGEDVGFVERYFPLTFNDDLHPDVKDNQLMFFLGGLFFPIAGNVWLPGLAGTGAQPEGFMSDAFLIWAAHAAVNVLPYCLLPCVVIPLVNIVVGVVLFGNSLCIVANALYFTPVAIANEYDRKLKAQGIPPSKPASALPPEAPAVATAMAF